MQKRDFRAIFLYEYKLGHNAAEAARNINRAFGVGTASERTIRFWFEKFRSGNESLENDDPATVDDTRLKQLVEENTKKTVRELANDLNVSVGSVSEHLRKIGKVKKLDKFNKTK
eukprot:gene30461-37793_t